MVSCTPNGDDPKAGYTIRHCGELIRRDAPADQLKMDFTPEAIETERAIRTLTIVVGPEEAYQFEDLKHDFVEKTNLISKSVSTKHLFFYEMSALLRECPTPFTVRYFFIP